MATAGRPSPLECIRCRTAAPDGWARRHHGCEPCRAAGVPSNFRWVADPGPLRALLGTSDQGRGIWRFGPMLPVAHGETLGEGSTPLLHLERLGERLGLVGLYAKNESVNPTWSHKDRLAAATVAAAAAAGARVVAAASTGNHGAAVAAYAARTGLHCVIATRESVPRVMKDLMTSYGAHVVATATGPERYELIQRGVEELGWYPASNVVSPAVGSDAYGITGYKTIAYELYEQLGDVPDWVVLPTAYGDCLAGVVDGFVDLQRAGITDRVPRLAASEVFGVLGGALGGGPLGPVRTTATSAFSIASSSTTYQAVDALRTSEGVAVTVREDEILGARGLLAREGLFAEAAAAAALAAVPRLLADGHLRASDRVVFLHTSTGLKDSATAGEPGAVPVTLPRLELARAALRASGSTDADSDRAVFTDAVAAL